MIQDGKNATRRSLGERVGTVTLSVTAVLAVISAGVLPFIRAAVTPPSTAYLSTILGVLGFVLGYVVTRGEKNASLLEELQRKVDSSHPAVEIFSTVEEWSKALLEESARSDSVRSQMFSDPPYEVGRHMTEYFRKIHDRIRNQTVAFWRLASVHEAKKVRWLFRSLIELADADNFSLSIVHINHRAYPLSSFQICKRDNNYSVFVFSSNVIEPGAHTCLVRDNNFGSVAERAFERFWKQGICLKAGSQFDLKEIEALARQFDLLTSSEYLDLRGIIEHRAAALDT